jgi:penicillin-binding protein A
MSDSLPQDSNSSPLLQRVVTKEQSTAPESRKSLPNFPRKGRIRAILVLILIIIAVIAIRHQCSAPEKDTGKKEKPAPAKTKQPAKIKRQSGGLSCAPQPSIVTGEYSPDKVAAILRDRPPRLSFATDTVLFVNNQLILHYSLDTNLQRYASRLLAQYHPRYGAIAAINPRNGRVLMLLSYTNDSMPSLGRNLCCRSIFPAASIFKTITAATALEKAHLSPQSKLRQSGSNHTLYKSQLKENLSYSIEIPLTEAYAKSINPIFGRLGIYTVGKEALYQYAERFGFTQSVPFDLPVEAGAVSPADSDYAIAELASGFNQRTRMSPLLGALIAGTAITDGKMFRPTLVDSITGFSHGTTVYRTEPDLWTAAIKPQTAADIKSMMEDVVQYGTGRKSFRIVKRSSWSRGWEFGGKTGNLNQDSLGRVDWFIGFLRNTSQPKNSIAIGIVTVHGAYWTIHSSRLAADIFTRYAMNLKRDAKLQAEIAAAATADTATDTAETEDEQNHE